MVTKTAKAKRIVLFVPIVVIVPIVLPVTADSIGGFPELALVTYRFGPYTLDPAAYRLLRDAEVVQLSPKIIDLLLYLVARQPALVSKDDLFKALWPDVAVTDNALTQAVSELRQALGDDSVEADLRPDRRAPRLPLHRAGNDHRARQPRRPPASSVGGTDTAPLSRSAAAGDRRPRLRERQRRPRAGVAVVRHRRNRDQRSARHGAPPRRRPHARRRGGASAAAPDLSALRAELHLDLAVVGSFQRSGPRLRITARVVDAASGEATAEAKADGPLEQVFELQDRIVSQFSEALRIGTKQPRSLGDTSSLEAYRAFTEGRVRLESLDASQVPAAIADFEKAIALDPRYAAAHVGLANATFWQYEMSRARNQPDAGLLARAVDHVRRAIELERDLADAYATLSFLLMSAGRAPEALGRGAARRRARAALLGQPVPPRARRVGRGTAAGAGARARPLSGFSVRPLRDGDGAHRARPSRSGRARAARGDGRAGSSGRSQAAISRQGPPLAARPGAPGVRRDTARRCVEFEREIASGTWQLYGREFAMNAHDGAGFAHLDAARARRSRRSVQQGARALSRARAIARRARRRPCGRRRCRMARMHACERARRRSRRCAAAAASARR